MPEQKKRLLKAKIAVALHDELGRVPKTEVQYPRTFSTDLITLSCKMLKEAILLGLQEPSRPWGPPVGWHFPHDAEQLECKQCQLYHGKVLILLAALCIDRGNPPLCRIIEARIERDELLRVLYPQGVIIDQDLHRLCPEGSINIQAEVVESNLPVLAYLARQLAEAEDPAQADRVNSQGDRILIPCNDVDRRLENDLIIGS